MEKFESVQLKEHDYYIEAFIEEEWQLGSTAKTLQMDSKMTYLGTENVYAEYSVANFLNFK